SPERRSTWTAATPMAADGPPSSTGKLVARRRAVEIGENRPPAALHLVLRDTRAPQPRPCSRILAVGAADSLRYGVESLPVGALTTGLARGRATSCGLLPLCFRPGGENLSSFARAIASSQASASRERVNASFACFCAWRTAAAAFSTR